MPKSRKWQRQPFHLWCQTSNQSLKHTIHCLTTWTQYGYHLACVNIHNWLCVCRNNTVSHGQTGSCQLTSMRLKGHIGWPQSNKRNSWHFIGWSDGRGHLDSFILRYNGGNKSACRIFHVISIIIIISPFFFFFADFHTVYVAWVYTYIYWENERNLLSQHRLAKISP